MKIKARLKAIIESRDPRIGRGFDFTVQALVVLSTISFTLETLPGLTAKQHQLFRYLEIGFVAIFTLEYLLRLWVAQSRAKFAFSFYGLVDAGAILPFYLAMGLDLRGIRALRLLRLFRILKLARYSQAISRLGLALKLAREELILFLAMSIIVIYLAAVGIYYFERDVQPEAFASIPHAMWWAVVTLTTVGYGDLYPVTAGGKVFTFLILFVGLGLVAVPAGITASALAKARQLQ